MKNHSKNGKLYWACYLGYEIQIDDSSRILEDWNQRNSNIEVAFHEPNYLHVTLLFFPWLREFEVIEINNVLNQFPFFRKEINLVCTGKPLILGHGDSSTYLTLEIENDLDELKSKLEKEILNRNIVPKSQKFVPHISLGRIDDIPSNKLNELKRYVFQNTSLLCLWESRSYAKKLSS